MSAWWSLPQAAPILLRHLHAYAELAEQDLANYSQRMTSRLIAVAVAVVATLFTLALICVAVIAATWDTPHRMLAIYCMLGVFAVIALIAAVNASSSGSPGSSMFAAVKREWSEDRVILDRILAAQDHDGSK